VHYAADEGDRGLGEGGWEGGNQRVDGLRELEGRAEGESVHATVSTPTMPEKERKKTVSEAATIHGWNPG
jgi:hypothetical protein